LYDCQHLKINQIYFYQGGRCFPCLDLDFNGIGQKLPNWLRLHQFAESVAISCHPSAAVGWMMIPIAPIGIKYTPLLLLWPLLGFSATLLIFVDFHF